MALSIPSDEVKAVMEIMRIRQEEAKVRALEEQRLREEEARIKQEEAKKVRQLLIEAEAIMRLDIENYDQVSIDNIKDTIKQYPNMHIIELRGMIGSPHKNMYTCTSGNCGLCGLCILRMSMVDQNNPISLKRREIWYDFIDQCVKEVQEEVACKNEVNKLEARTNLCSDIAKANKALPLNKINGGEFEEERLEIDYIIALDNPIPSMADTRSSGLYFETRHLWESINIQIQNRANPQLKEIPVSWNNDYKDNKIPFLPQCPVCSRQNTILFKWVGGQYGSPRVYTKAIDTVQCFPHTSHYIWDSNKMKV
jgi:hypothetical protein